MRRIFRCPVPLSQKLSPPSHEKECSGTPQSGHMLGFSVVCPSVPDIILKNQKLHISGVIMRKRRRSLTKSGLYIKSPKNGTVGQKAIWRRQRQISGTDKQPHRSNTNSAPRPEKPLRHVHLPLGQWSGCRSARVPEDRVNMTKAATPVRPPLRRLEHAVRTMAPSSSYGTIATAS